MPGVTNKSIGQYQVIEFVARGDTAFIYKGYQPAMNRFVAIKVLSPSLARNPEAAKSFQHQAEIMAQLDHAGILSVFDYGLDQNLPYLVSRLVEGGTLKSRLAQFRSANNALELLDSIVAALEYLHEQGIVHGNLKSTNILLDNQNQPLLTDIGMDQADISGQVYLSPEGAQGGPVDRRADVYALGVLLYEMLVEQPPHVGMAPKLLQVRPDLPATIEAVLLKAMSQFPEERYQSAREFQQALTVAIQDDIDVPVSLTDQITPEPLVYAVPEQDAKKDNRWMFIAGAILFMVFMCWFVVAGLFFLIVREDEAQLRSSDSMPHLTADTIQSVYAGPGTQFAVEGALVAGQTAQVLGVSADGEWWNILFPRGEDGTGWVSAELVTAENVDDISVIEPDAVPVAFNPILNSFRYDCLVFA